MKLGSRYDVKIPSELIKRFAEGNEEQKQEAQRDTKIIRGLAEIAGAEIVEKEIEKRGVDAALDYLINEYFD